MAINDELVERGKEFAQTFWRDFQSEREESIETFVYKDRVILVCRETWLHSFTEEDLVDIGS